MTGIIGVVLGAEASRRFKRVNPRAEPLVCACSLLAAAPCLYLALLLARTTFTVSYVSARSLRGTGGRAALSMRADAAPIPTLCPPLLPGGLCRPRFTDG